MSNESREQPNSYDKELMSLVSKDLAEIQLELKGKIRNSWTIFRQRSSNEYCIQIIIVFSNTNKQEKYEIDIIEEWKSLKYEIIRKASCT